MPFADSFRCNYCNDNTGVHLFASTDTCGRTWEWKRCTRCASTSLHPRPSSEELAAAYSATYYGESEDKFTGSVERFLDTCRARRARSVAARLPAGGTVLDVGCGNGGFLAAVGEHGSYRLLGIELDGAAARRAARRAHVELMLGFVHQQTLAPESIDTITLFHVFEHLTDPQGDLEILTKALKTGGYLVISFPNIGSAQAKLFRGHWLHLDPPRHLFLPQRDAFISDVTNRGFTLIAERHVSLEQNPFGFIQSLLNVFLKDRDVLYERLKRNHRYAPSHGAGSLLLQKAVAAVLLPFAILADVVESALKRGATIEFTFQKNA